MSVVRSPGDEFVHLVSPQHLPGGGAAVTHADVTDMIRASRSYQRRAERDSLTDVLNHRAFHERGDRLTREIVRDGRQVAMMMTDLDDFEAVNDTYGHAIGDAVLMPAAKRLRHALRERDLAGRVCGDEFAIAKCDVTDPHHLASRIRRTMSAPVASDGTTVRVRQPVGLALAPRDGTSFDALLRLSDQRMFAHKRIDGITTRAEQGEALA